jgi:hypothetical protein
MLSERVFFQRSIGPGSNPPTSLSPERTHAGSDTQRGWRSPLYDFFVDRDSLNRTLSGCRCQGQRDLDTAIRG